MRNSCRVSQAPPPQLSPDGRYYWNGQSWQPVAQPSLPAGPIGQPQGLVATYPPATNGLATASLIFGIGSWFVCPFVGGVVAVICGHMAHSQIKQTGEGGGGLATAGLVLGYLHLAAAVFVVIFSIVVFGSLAALLAAVGTTVPSPTP